MGPSFYIVGILDFDLSAVQAWTLDPKDKGKVFINILIQDLGSYV